MKCSEATKMLQLYMDQQLTVEQIRALESHIYACQSCREEYYLLEEIQQSVHTMQMVAEPPDLTMNIMRRVAAHPRAMTQQAYQQKTFVLFRPSFSEILIAIVLATVTMLGAALEQPAIRATIWPAVNDHDSISLFVNTIWRLLSSANTETLMLGLWIVGTLLGVWITLAAAGSDMRNAWFRAVVSRLPVW